MANPKPPKKTKPKFSLSSFWKRVASYPLKLFKKIDKIWLYNIVVEFLMIVLLIGEKLTLMKSLIFKLGSIFFTLLKRIYRNSEGHIIPLLGGVLALSIFYSINAWLHVYRAAIGISPSATAQIENGGNSVNKVIVFLPLGIFIVFLFCVWGIIYQLKKANLRDDTVKALEEMLIKHYEPYIHSRESGEIKNKNFYYSVYFNASRVSDSLEKYMIYTKIKSLFNKNEIKTMKEKTIKNIGFFIEREMRKTPFGVELQFREQNGIRFYQVIKNNQAQNYNFLMILKEGDKNNPKNLTAFRVDIEKNKPPFVVLENLKPKKGEQRFLDVNARQISYVEYQKDKVKLIIIQPNVSPRKIIVSLSEWLANRNDLR